MGEHNPVKMKLFQTNFDKNEDYVASIYYKNLQPIENVKFSSGTYDIDTSRLFKFEVFNNRIFLFIITIGDEIYSNQRFLEIRPPSNKCQMVNSNAVHFDNVYILIV